MKIPITYHIITHPQLAAIKNINNCQWFICECQQ